MSIDLLNSIINGDYVSANRLFEERLNNIQEKKLYEVKRMMQSEVFGGLSKDEIESRRKSGYRKASEVLGDPTKADNLSARKSQMDSGTSSSASEKSQPQSTDKLRKLPSLADMKKASRERRLASIGARAERLRQRGHSDPGRHLARAYGSSIGGKIGKALKTPAKIAAGVASDIANAVALEE